jgi:hypothetical protein
MNASTITALAAISGSMVGALSSLAASWVSQRHQGRRDLLTKKIAHREALYSGFISEATRLLVDALEHNFNDPKNLIPSYVQLGRIRLDSSRQISRAAEQVVKLIMDAYTNPNLTAELIQSAAITGDDPLRVFSDIWRAELESMRGEL